MPGESVSRALESQESSFIFALYFNINYNKIKYFSVKFFEF